MLSVIVSIATLNFGPAYAGGDPSIKDTKIIEKKSNIVQHSHNQTSNDKIKKSSNKSVNNSSTKSYNNEKL